MHPINSVLSSIALTLLGGLLALPVLGVFAAWLSLDAANLASLQHQFSTVMPEYAWQSLVLALGVGVGVVLLGTATAVAVTLFAFPGRRVFEWALLLPLAMPAYVLAYAYTDALQFSGPVQGALRQALGASGALWPDVRSLPWAVLLFVLCLYPYVYLLVRAALGERAVRLMEAARLLGAPMRRRVMEVALPMARPAIAAGTALALMETLADYGVGSYFGLATFSTGIYKAWLVLGDQAVAAQLAAVLLVVVAALLATERAAQRRLRFVTGKSGHPANEARPLALGVRGVLAAWLLCGVPVLLGFVLPVLWLLAHAFNESSYGELGLPWLRFFDWSFNSFRLAILAALLATGLALALAFSMRRAKRGVRNWPLRAVGRLLSLGYAVPGGVVAVGVLGPLAWWQAHVPGWDAAGWVTGTMLGVLLAYLVRFSAVALQSVEAGYARVPGTVDETARMLGGDGQRIFFKLHLPLLKKSALAAGLLVFVDVMKELPATLLLRPFGSDTLAVVAYNFARDERLAEAALPSLAIVMVGLLPVILLSRAMRAPASESPGKQRS
jgi:iron(III) transport system permease protein